MYNCYVTILMPRTKTIDYRRMTFSLPAEVVDQLKITVKKNNMSNFVSNALKKSFLTQKKDSDDLIESLRKFARENKPKTNKSTLEILREIRYGGKY